MFDSITHPQQRAFLAAYASCGSVKRAAKAAGVSREAHYDWKRRHPEYAEALELATEMGADALEDEATRRGQLGVLEPVYQGGEKVGVKRRYSDSLLLAMLRGIRPHKFALQKRELSGTVEHRHEHRVDLSVFTDAELEQLRELAEQLHGRALERAGNGLAAGSRPGISAPSGGAET
jgi:hypothetical protein